MSPRSHTISSRFWRLLWQSGLMLVLLAGVLLHSFQAFGYFSSFHLSTLPYKPAPVHSELSDGV